MPSWNSSLKEVNGTWGLSAKVVVRRPVFGSALTLPISLAEIPKRADSASTKIRYSSPEVGIAAELLAEEDVAGERAGGSGGVWIATVPIFEPAGQETGCRLPLLNWSSLQNLSWSALAGLRPMPSGSETRAVFTFELAIGGTALKGT